MPRTQQRPLPFSPIRNSELLSSHWLQHRLPLEAEWTELRGDAQLVLDRLNNLWAVQKDRVPLYGGEQALEQAFIQPVLGELGWSLFYQTHLRGREPDYALFLQDADLDGAVKAGRTSPRFWEYPKLLADAKAWHVNLDRPIVVNNRREYPPEQIEWYLNSSQLDYAILTNGKLWRLIPRQLTPEQPRFQTYLECDLPALLEAWRQAKDLFARDRVLDDFLSFFLFFSPHACREADGRAALIERAVRGSSEYRLGVGEDLKERVFEALRLCIDGFLKHKRNGLDPVADLALCREQSFVALYRLLFIFYAEDRGLLPYRKNRLYTENRSLGRKRVEIAAELDRAAAGRGRELSRNATDLWEELRVLFDLINSGHKRYGVPPYNGGLFDESQHPFLAEKALPDWSLARVIDQLSRAQDAAHPERGLFLVDYRDLQIQHLGSIYEGLLELHPYIATEPIREIRSRTQGSQRVISMRVRLPEGYELTGRTFEPGELYLLTEKGERRTTGSYYTPNHIVDQLVRSTLRPLCDKIEAGLCADIEAMEQNLPGTPPAERPAVEERLKLLWSDFDDRVLSLRVLDPAMGSGHFLLRACQYLAEEITRNPFAGQPEAGELADEESALTFWKRRVVEHCLYGVDVNPLTVELAKLALWLETVSVDQPLTFLDHHLRTGNSLVGAPIAELGHLPGAKPLLHDVFARQVEEKLPSLLEPLAEILRLQSDTPEHVKAKESFLRQFFDRRQSFVNLAHLWCAAFYLDGDQQPAQSEYQKVLDSLSSPAAMARLSKEPWFRAGTHCAKEPDARFFHWELEFSEVFFGDTGRRPDAGFDAVIGNPPYDVLSEKETGQKLAAFKAFATALPPMADRDGARMRVYAPSFRGKNNLYKLFICRALELLADGGRLGLITPMALLGDDQAAGLRREILRVGALTSIEAFPQKDDRERRVFREAKLSTVAFTALKTTNESERKASFLSRVHPAQFIEEGSPSLKLSTAEIPLYDPENLAIVSCGQEDWDIAVRIMRSGRLTRLGTLCVSYQGEVNETNERERRSLSKNPADGPLILRGANVCLYAIRPASQGEPLYLKRTSFLKERSSDSKAYHFRQARLGFQRSSPQNNFRRVIAAPIEREEFCFDTVSYVPASECRLSPLFLLGLLNSKLVDWYFRLGSTNSKVNEYQFNNLPCPVFVDAVSAAERRELALASDDMDTGDHDAVFDRLKSGTSAPPFSAGVREIIAELVTRIITIERERGAISRSERSNLAPAAQPLQCLIDRFLYAMVGLTADEARGLEDRLERML